MNAPPLAITEPGIYGIPAEVYHADPVPEGSLSSSGARKLLPPSCPAKFRYEQDNPPSPKDVFDFGTAAHRQVLGAGLPICSLAFDDWTTKAARKARDEAREAGYVPLLTAECDRVNAMADALKQHPVARQLFNREFGEPEQALFWQDPVTGVWRRALLDWLPEPASGRLIIADYKTTVSADPASIRKHVANFGYHQQHAWYIDGAEVFFGPDVAFVFVFQEKAPPYLVTICELDAPAVRAGRELNRLAIERYRDCREAGVWPGYSGDVELISLPPWALSNYGEIL